MLWEVVRNLVPRCLRANKDVLARRVARITIHRSYHDLTNYAGVCTCQGSSARLAEATCISGGRFIALDKVFARCPFESSRLQDSPGRERSTVRLPALGAVAVAEELEWRRNFERYGPTKAASLYSHAQTFRHGVYEANANLTGACGARQRTGEGRASGSMRG